MSMTQNLSWPKSKRKILRLLPLTLRATMDHNIANDLPCLICERLKYRTRKCFLGVKNVWIGSRIWD